MTQKSKTINLQSSLAEIVGIGPKKAECLKKLGLFRLQDMLSFYPRAYRDYRNPTKICDLKNDQNALVIARILLVQPGKGFGRKRTLHLLCEDDTGRMEVLFFSAGYMIKSFTIGDTYTFYGKVKNENRRVTMFHPEYAVFSENNEGIVPIYPLTKGLGQKDMIRLEKQALEHCGELEESLPESIINSAKLCGNDFAFRNIHFPEGEDEYKQAKYRLIYEELFDLKLALELSSGSSKDLKGISISSGRSNDFIDSLSFELTSAQKKALSEILDDMKSDKRMNRLLQGDVGCGKTVVAEAAIAEAVFAGFQALFMAPTEILAKQHYEHLKADFGAFGIECALLTSSVSTAERKVLLRRIENGEIPVVIGTHALISGDVKYSNVGLVITDEQHRFGVSQREKLSLKGEAPNILVMTATPIPRTLALTLFADLSFSIIDELPKGRKPIFTKKYSESERIEAYKLLFNEVKKGRQAYIVAPFIEDSESLNGRSAETLYNAFVKKHPEISCALLHGELKQAEKDSIMQRFASGEISVLISTVIIEVGIDVANAAVMLIENSERFGLSQLHQLRGRVGRGSWDSYCLLCIGDDSDIANERADMMCESNDGFKIAEKDLEMRGPGEFFGYKQHGLPQLVLADPIKHAQVLKNAGQDAVDLISADPGLQKPENSCLRTIINEKYLKVDKLTL